GDGRGGDAELGAEAGRGRHRVPPDLCGRRPHSRRRRGAGAGGRRGDGRPGGPAQGAGGEAVGKSRFSRTSTSSSADRKRERSALEKGGGPPIPSPVIPARRSAMIARVATADPID